MTKEAKQIDWKKLHPWMQMADEFATANQGYFVIKTDSKEFSVWLRYFQRMRWAPWGFRRLLDIERDNMEWTAPCQFPEWLPKLDQWCAKNRPALPRPEAAE
jgi:hypothetical protein